MSTPQNLTPDQSPKKKLTSADIEKMRLRDRQLVRGKFHFHEVPGGVVEFSFKKYKQDPVENYRLFDGEIYSIPMGVAHHLNNNTWYPEYSYAKGENNYDVQRMTKKVNRMSFQSLEFVEYDDMKQSNLVKVENANTGLFVRGMSV